MKKLLAALSAALMMMALFGAAGAQAAQPEDKGPGPNGSNEKGLCTAYFNGQKNGHDKNGNPGPFAELERDADDGNPDNDKDGTGDEDLSAEQQPYSDVYEFCQEFGIMGQPEHNGRYDCEEPASGTGRDNDTDGQIECYENDGTAGLDENDDPYDTGNDHPSDKG